ncbi:DUF3570 domain-containing protein [uncultured Ferrimonas sp.]|uniref:DUF3570 domain-containing protein n=1 Tax=uncultured Ferrimonas sp. TaxID=432640 RepID=UPI002609AB92|nr:DUF3570 domain-containing protein [uncultured Ferrimonas sp.]
MQLKPFKSISGALAVASLNAVAPAQAAWFEDSDDHDWQFDTAVMAYAEGDDRVQALEGAVVATRTDGDDNTLSLSATIDSLTGASPTGAVQQTQAQTFTRPSGNGSYTVAAGATPLDDTFKDTRVQLNAGWAANINRYWQYDVGGHLSKEYDYLSLGINGGLARHFNNKNTTVRLGSSVFFDTFEPEGGLPVALAAMVKRSDFATDEAFQQAFDATRAGSNDTKTIVEATLGLTQVINRSTVMQVNYSYAEASGYLTDPFKLVSVVDGSGTVQSHRYEQRPDSRRKHAFFWQTKTHLGGPVLDVSYRFMSDDWQVDSHTVDGRVDYRLSNGHYLEPHLRYYQQSSAEFYRPYLLAGQPLPTGLDAVSADYRLAKMTTYTIGVKYGMPRANGDEMAWRLEYYLQQPNGNRSDQPGQLAGVDLTPEVTALMLQFSYRFH